MSSQIQTRQYVVHGMTCDHCVLSVREEVAEVPGVQAVEVDLSGHMSVAGTEIDDGAIANAVAEAGYEVAT